MITLKSITKEDINVLDDFSYGSMPKDSREQMISHSIMRNHNGKYFEFFFPIAHTEITILSLPVISPPTTFTLYSLQISFHIILKQKQFNKNLQFQ